MKQRGKSRAQRAENAGCGTHCPRALTPATALRRIQSLTDKPLGQRQRLTKTERWQMDWWKTASRASGQPERGQVFETTDWKYRKKKKPVRISHPGIRLSVSSHLIPLTPYVRLTVQHQRWVRRLGIFPSYPFPFFPLVMSEVVGGVRESVCVGIVAIMPTSTFVSKWGDDFLHQLNIKDDKKKR